MSRLFYLLLAFVAVAQAQKFFRGPCPTVVPISDFSFSSFAGKWYEQERTDNVFERNGKCVTTEYAVNGSNYNMTTNMQHNTTQASSSFNALLTPSGNGTDGLYKMSIYNKTSFPLSYNVLDTDYKYYAVIYSCTNFQIFNIRMSWILTRQRYPADLNAAYGALKKQGLTQTDNFKTDQFWCPIFH